MNCVVGSSCDRSTSSSSSFNKYYVQLKMMPFAHCSSSSTVLVVHSVGCILRNILHDRIFAVNLTVLTVIEEMRNPLFARWSSYFCFIFVVALFGHKYGVGLWLWCERPVINEMSSTSTDYGLSSHRYPPWKQTRSCFT